MTKVQRGERHALERRKITHLAAGKVQCGERHALERRQVPDLGVNEVQRVSGMPLSGDRSCIGQLRQDQRGERHALER